MSWVKLPADLSAQPLARKVEQRFGLVGFARLVKLLELLAASAERDACVIALPASDWEEALQVGRADLDTFLAYLEAAGWLSRDQGAEPGAPLRVTLLQAETLLPAATDPQLFSRANQWAQWCTAELGMPPGVTSDPYTLQLFRRWCASNVTLDEMQEAVQLAIAKHNSLKPTDLHEMLQAVRRTRLERARQ